ncbi:MAG: hypothetical protein WCF33_19990 [Pseudonocardiaceae bacterium]
MSDQSPAQPPNPGPATPGTPSPQPAASPDPARAAVPAPEAVKAEPHAPDHHGSPPDSADPMAVAAEEQRAADGAMRREIVAAATNPGDTAARRKLRDDGRRNLGVLDSSTTTDFRARVAVAHDLIGRNQINHYYAATPDPRGHYAIRSTACEEIAVTYVEPDGFASLVSFCGKRHIAVIRVAAGQGKLTSALRVLDRICTGPLFRLDPTKGMTHLRGEDITEGSGYLLTGLTQSQADDLLTRHEMDRLDAELNDRSARLIVAVSAETRLTHLGSADYVTDLTHRPEHRNVLASHLKLKLDEHDSEWLISHADIAAILDTELRPGTPLRKVVQLAELIAEAARGKTAPPEIAETVRLQLAARADRDLADWFQGLGGLAEHSFVIALAVLNNLPYETVAKAGRDLETRLTTPITGRLEDLPRDQIRPFERSRSARLKMFDAKLTPAMATTPQGDVPVEAVEFVDPTRPKRVLAHVWQEYDKAHNAVLEWLSALGAHPVEEVRTRAGVAVGALSTAAFDFIRHTVVEPWAYATDYVLRESAATALDAANSVPALKETVRELVHEWSTANDPNLVATAVRVYGGSVGVDQPTRLFETLNQHAESSDFVVIHAVCRSLAELADAGVVGVSDRALMTAREWTNSRTRTRRITGNMAFLIMAHDLLWSQEGTSPRQGRSGRSQHWPLLLKLADSSPEWRQVVAGMWATALMSADVAEIAMEALDQWTETAEESDQRRQAFVQMLTAAATSNRVQARLRRKMEQWADPENTIHAPETATALRVST